MSRPVEGRPSELVRPYGDRRDDGVVQLSFVLPVAAGERAREAATEVARKMGLSGIHVAAMEKAGERLHLLRGLRSHRRVGRPAPRSTCPR